MQTLILDTSSEEGVLALAAEGRLVTELRLPNGPELSRRLSLEVAKFPKPDQIVVGTGPGSLTGVRVGLALAQALSFGWRIPLLRVSSLEGFPEEVVVLDLRSSGLCVRIRGEAPRIL